MADRVVFWTVVVSLGLIGVGILSMIAVWLWPLIGLFTRPKCWHPFDDE